MRTRFTLLALLALLAACTASPTAGDAAGQQSQYVGPGSSGDQAP
jgi:hypothetical protein